MQKSIMELVRQFSTDTTWTRDPSPSMDAIIAFALRHRRDSMQAQEARDSAGTMFAADGALVPRYVPGMQIEHTWHAVNTRTADARAALQMRDREIEKLDTALRAQYRDEISSWDWAAIVADARGNAESDPDADGAVIGRDYLGSVLSLYPSGKIYAPWTSNQTELDVIKDTAFSETLEEIADDHGGWIDCDSGDVLFCIAVDAPNDED